MNKFTNVKLKILVIFQIVILLFPTTYTFANTNEKSSNNIQNTEIEVKAEIQEKNEAEKSIKEIENSSEQNKEKTKEIIIGKEIENSSEQNKEKTKEIIIGKETEKFYSIEKWNEEEKEWSYIDCEMEYYTNEKNEKEFIYNIEKLLEEKETEKENQDTQEKITYKINKTSKITNEKILNVLKNSYPNKTKEDLEVETEYDAYYATREAIVYILEEKKLEDIDKNLRVGSKVVNNQKIEEMQTRGEKILIAIRKLLKTAEKQQIETNVVTKITPKGEFVIDENVNYFSQKYVLNTNDNTSINIISIENAPEGTYVADLNGNEKNIFSYNEEFKIMVPKDKIDKDYNITINYIENVQTYKTYEVENENKEETKIITKETTQKEGKFELKINSDLSYLKIIQEDEETNNPIAGAEFLIEYDIGEIIGTYKTDENGEINLSKLKPYNIIIKENSIDEKYIQNEEIRKIKLEYNSEYILEEKRELKKGQIRIKNTSADRNDILDVEAGTPIENSKFNIYDLNNSLIEHITTDKEGVAITSKLAKGTYIIQEEQTGKWYVPNKESYKIEITQNNEIIELNTVNKSKSPQIKIEQSYKNTISSNEEFEYKYEIKNTGNTEFEDFTYYNILPYEHTKIEKILTGTYNQNVNYSIYYKTNQKAEYMVLKKDINSTENNEINLTNLHLNSGEKITEFKFCFGKVEENFKNIEKVHLYMKANNELENDTQIKNYIILEAYNQGYKVSDEMTARSTVYNLATQKRLPRTGF